MEKVYRYPSRDLPQVYWHLQDCAARFGYELHRQADPREPGTPRGASFEIFYKATQHNVGQIRVDENQFGALITVADEGQETPATPADVPSPMAPSGHRDAAALNDRPQAKGQPGLFAELIDDLFGCVAIPPERRARRWPR